MASTMMVGGTIAAIGLAASMTLNTTVAPFILRGVSLLGIDSGTTPMPLRREVWRRLASDLRPPHLKDMTRTLPFDELPKAFDAFIKGAAKGRLVVDMAA
jgi:NADPH:quinone reductase-like Zn-dependent oxidoreductase